MNERFFEWRSSYIDQNLRMLVYGSGGLPVLLFPTSKGRYYQYKDFGFVDLAASYLSEGKISLYCIDSVDERSWYNTSIHPQHRVKTHAAYDRALRWEVFEQIRQETGRERIAVGGASFGAYHAACFAFRYPELCGHLMAMGGAFNIADQLDGHFDQEAYFYNPLSFVPDLHHHALHQMSIALGVGEHDFLRQDNEAFSAVLARKGLAHWLDIRAGYDHDWPGWRAMWSDYLFKLATDLS